MNKIILFGVLLLLGLQAVSGHVSYVLEDQELESNLGSDITYFLSPLQDLTNSILVAITLIVIILLYVFLPKLPLFSKRTKHIRKEANTYADHVPWIARLGLGIALIGAGTAKVLVSPTLETTAIFSSIQILLGFLLLAGFLTSIAAWGAVALYLVALFNNLYIIGNLDFLGLALALIATQDTEPGIDDLLGIPFFFSLKSLKKHIPLLCSLSIGFAMIYLAIFEKILNPHISRLVVEQYALTSVIPVSAAMWVFAAGVIELAVGLLLFMRFKPRLVSTIAFIVLSASFFYFNEEVFSHITLFAILSIVFIYGSNKTQKKRL